MFRGLVVCIGLVGSLVAGEVPTAERWRLEGGRLIWEVGRAGQLPHQDRVEMSGRRAAAWVTYGADAQGRLELSPWCIWPTLRVAPNDTHASLMVRFHRDRAPELLNGKPRRSLDVAPGARFTPLVTVEGRPQEAETLERVVFEEGLLRLTSRLEGGLCLTRDILASAEGTGLLERWTIQNTGAAALRVAVAPLATEGRLPFDYVDKGLFQAGKPIPTAQQRTGTYGIGVFSEGLSEQRLASGAAVTLCVAYTAWDTAAPRPVFDADREVEARQAFTRATREALRFECPDPVLSTLFDFSKLRAAESIIATKHGPMHAPGGGSYYAAVWGNDSVEYVAPFYPFLGHAYGNEASLNTFRHYARYLNPAFQPLPSSIIAEGTDIWAGAGDRGDQAMIAYGASRALLAMGDAAEARKHWPLVTWCLDYLAQKKTPEGVIASDADELEGRFSHGKTNLNTSVLTYGGLLAGADLAVALGEPERAKGYRAEAAALRQAIERFFGREVQGFRTYRYHEGLDTLRAWICMPLTMGILDRKEGTLAALFSPRLWTPDGLLTAEGSTTFWDRSSLYALRAAFQAGDAERGLPHLQALSRRRLLGEHVPYVVEAYPEGQGRHLSAESALYCRIVTEGMFGLEPVGFRSFTLKPCLPKGWDRMALREVKAFGTRFDVEVKRLRPGRLQVTVRRGAKLLERLALKEGAELKVTLAL